MTDILTQLKDDLKVFEDFLKSNADTIHKAFQALHSLFPQVDELLDKLIKLMTDIQTEVQSLDITAIPGVQQVTGFTDALKSLLGTLRNLLPNDQKSIDEVLSVANVVGELPQLGGDTKKAVLDSIAAIIGFLNQIKAP